MAAQISTKPLISMGQRLGMIFFLGMPRLRILLGRPHAVKREEEVKYGKNIKPFPL
jgi:hypothetical protein